MLGVFFICIAIILIFLFIKNYYLVGKLKSLKNKHVVITGGSSGIGRSVAIECVRRGAHVTIIARNIGKLIEAKQEILNARENEDQRINCESLDVTDATQVQVVFERLEAENPIYMLVNCAGMALMGTLEDMKVADIDFIIKLNLFGTIYPTRAVVGNMKKRQQGIIVITASQAALLGIYGCSAYSASKFALRGLAESLHMETKPHNVSVVLALPPDTDTPGFENEEKTKPIETKLICEEGGLLSPDQVGKQIVVDALRSRFCSYNLSAATFAVTTVTAGMSPPSSLSELLLQVFLMSPLRLVSVFYLKSFENIIVKCMKRKSLRKDE